MEHTDNRPSLAATGPNAVRERELAGLLAASRAVLRHRGFAAAARAIFEHCRELIGAPAGYISLANEAGDANEVVFLEAGGLPCTVDPLAPMPIRGLRAEAYATGTVVYDNHFMASPLQEFLPPGHVALENVLFAPLNHEGKTVGLLGLANKPGGFTDSDCRLAAGFAELAAIALVNSRAQEAVQRSEAQLKEAHERLEQRVQERTAELRQANEQLVREVAQRRQAEARLRESEARYRTLFQTAASLVCSVCPSGRLLEFNEEAERLTGWRKEEVRGREAFALFLREEDQPRAREAFARVLAGEMTRNFELPIRLKDGSQRHFLWNANLVQDAAGQPVEVIVVGQDITTLRQAQESLEAERQRLFALLEHLPAYVFLQAPDHTVKFANRFFRDNFGDPRGRACHEVLWGREEPCKECPTLAVFRTGKPHVWEWTRHDGRTFQIYDYPFADLDGSPLVLEMGIDITAHKRAEEALKEQSRVMEAFFAHTPTPLVFLDREFNLFRVNEAYARACRRKAADLVGRNLFELFPQPENQALFAETLRAKKPCAAWAQPYVFPDHPEWGVTYWDWTLVPILDEAGEVDFLVLSSQDVTERVRAEETHTRLIAILEATPDLVAIADVSRRMRYLNRAGRRMLGLGPQDELEDFLLAHPPGVREKIEREALPAARARGVWRGETSVWSPDGEEIPVSQVILVHRDQDGQDQFYSTIARDIRDRRETEAQLRGLTSQLLTAQEQERRRLSRELHDELGQSLLVLKMQIRALERRLADSPQRQDCDRSLRYIDEIIENVRRLSRDLSPAVLDDLGLSAALRHLLDEFRRHPDFPQIHAEMEQVDEFLSREVQINLYRVFQEALTNIAKHAGASRVDIRLELRGGRIVGTVADDGRGFDLPGLRAEAEGLHGLGLAAMEERLRILGGVFQVDSRPGGGSRINFSLPVQEGGGEP